MIRSLAIVLLCVAAAVGYGILHDQATARICVEYFTIWHPPIFVTNDPTTLGLGWGVISTWWAGLMLGIPLAFAARFGRLPKWTASRLVRPIVKLLSLMAGRMRPDLWVCGMVRSGLRNRRPTRAPFA